MGIKLGSIITAILFLFIAKISLEAGMDTQNPAKAAASAVPGPIGRTPASLSSIDEGYAEHIKGPQKAKTH